MEYCTIRKTRPTPASGFPVPDKFNRTLRDEPPPTVRRAELAAEWALRMNSYPEVG